MRCTKRFFIFTLFQYPIGFCLIQNTDDGVVDVDGKDDDDVLGDDGGDDDGGGCGVDGDGDAADDGGYGHDAGDGDHPEDDVLDV